MQGNSIILFLGIALLLLSCKKELESEEYAKYVTNPENGLRKDRTVKKFKISAMYEPADYILSQSNDENDQEWGNELIKFEHFQFKIELLEGGNILNYQETPLSNEASRISYFSFLVKDNFKIVAENDTISCKIAHYSRNYNLSPTIDLSLTFEKLDKTVDWQLIYNDTQYNLGIVKFLFKQDDLLDVPALKK